MSIVCHISSGHCLNIGTHTEIHLYDVEHLVRSYSWIPWLLLLPTVKKTAKEAEYNWAQWNDYFENDSIQIKVIHWNEPNNHNKSNNKNSYISSVYLCVANVIVFNIYKHSIWMRGCAFVFVQFYRQTVWCKFMSCYLH